MLVFFLQSSTLSWLILGFIFAVKISLVNLIKSILRLFEFGMLLLNSE